MTLFGPELAAWHHLQRAVADKLTGADGVMLLLLWGTVFLAAGVTYFKFGPERRSLGGFRRYALPASVFTHASARADFLFWLTHRLVLAFLVVPLAVSTVAAGYAMHALLEALFGRPALPPGHAGPLMLGVFTVTMLLAYDLSYYIYHLLQHKVPLLWELHKVHHSAQILVGVTKDRVHPLDDLMNRWWDGLIPGACYGIWLFFALDPVELTVFGLNVYFLRNTLFMMDFVRHTHFKLSYGKWLNYVFLCPHWHQLHHSSNPKHFDRNYGLMLSVWDWAFGTLVVPAEGEEFAFGLAEYEHEEYQSVLRLYVLPLKKIWRMLRGPAAAPSRTPSEEPHQELLPQSRA